MTRTIFFTLEVRLGFVGFQVDGKALDFEFSHCVSLGGANPATG
jgi:hypothetical protein